MTHRSALRLPEHLSLEDWFQIGQEITIISDSSTWWLADWLVYGQDRYPGLYRKAIRDTSLDYQTLRNYAWIARKIPPERRRAKLSFQHHAEVASLPEAEQSLWLERAEREGWSRARLRRALRFGVDRQGAGRGAAAPRPFTVEVAPDRRDRWEAAAVKAGHSLDEWVLRALDRAADDALLLGEDAPALQSAELVLREVAATI
ncbi:LmbU family transcriptional regulator [Marinitenerispora sediminis]|uniref:LmbU family transcriptional regulator n=1 Tax=Marinitenerispora sediminis TaxID=1931232 RepID=UPI002163B158|nr:LmbU family transcriptional regulator [Marinitenerispora sediminis]